MGNKNYRCYFTDTGDRIRSYEQIECADDSAAALKVDELLATSQYSSAELWEGKRLVGKWTATGGGRANGTDGAGSDGDRTAPTGEALKAVSASLGETRD